MSQIRPEDWFVTIDLKDEIHRKFLRFDFGGKVYQYWVIPLSSCTFTKGMDATLIPLRLQGIRILNYIDDWFLLAQSEEMAFRYRDGVLCHIRCLGLGLIVKKSSLSPHQRTTFLEVVLNSTTIWAQLSPACIETILNTVAKSKLGQTITVKHFQSVWGLLAVMSNIIPFGLL